MSPTLAIVLAVLLVLMLVAGFAWAVRSGPPRAGRSSGLAQRERAIDAQIEVEEHDIDEMIEARDAIRRRLGKSSIGEELGREALRDEEDR